MDRYDENIAQLLNHPIGVYNDWSNGSPLFDYCDKSGCLTQVHSARYGDDPETYNLDKNIFEEIRSDDRIHDNATDLEEDIDKTETYEEIVNLLWPYAEWQRKLDTIYPNRNKD